MIEQVVNWYGSRVFTRLMTRVTVDGRVDMYVLHELLMHLTLYTSTPITLLDGQKMLVHSRFINVATLVDAVDYLVHSVNTGESIDVGMWMVENDLTRLDVWLADYGTVEEVLFVLAGRLKTIHMVKTTNVFYLVRKTQPVLKAVLELITTLGEFVYGKTY